MSETKTETKQGKEFPLSAAADLTTGDSCGTGKKAYTFITSRATLDGAYPALILALNARRLGHEATVFYTFMGINIIRKGYLRKLKFHMPGFLGALPGMSRLATRMMKKQIDEAGAPDLESLVEMALIEGVKLVACRMTMDMMKMKEDEFIEGVSVMNAEQYLKMAEKCSINMFT
ncbi:MAG: DsrE/DsrF/DrsH-like family protein [Proteobacteria bacterium]|nr:DsrE/DsrF/DrsH-like family protein [Pseudomonadota bacterium]